MDDELLGDLDRAKAAHVQASEQLARVLRSVAMARIREVLPDATVLETLGDVNEDLMPRLRTRRVLGADEVVLFDVVDGHEDRAVEDAVDEVDIEYLDPLAEVTSGSMAGLIRLRS